MNINEYYNSEINRKNPEYKQVQRLLKEWKHANNITEKCVAHHRDDTEECRKYNTEHYERWGCEEDGTFTLGKYVIFMTQADHVKHHRTGQHHSDEARKKIREASIGRHPSDEARQKMREAQLGERNHFYGKTHSEETIKKIREANIGKHHTDEAKLKMSESRSGKKNPMYGRNHTDEAKRRISEVKKSQIAELRKLYHAYISNGGLLKWNSFQSALKDNNPEVINLISDLLEVKGGI